MTPIARIEPLTTARAVRGPFDYRLPAGLADVEVGARLLVPFAGRDVPGVVVGLAATSEVPAERLAEPRERLGAPIPADLVELAGWLAREYCSTPARALALVAPPGAGRGRDTARPRRVLFAALTDAGRAAAGDPSVRLTAGQRAALGALAGAGSLPAGEAGLDHGGLRRLEARGLISLSRRELRRRPARASVGARRSSPPELTPAQRAALEPVLAALAGPRGAAPSFLLHGVTGSGKTEVYMRAVAAALSAGRGAIVLVPEIALTPQTTARFGERFGDVVAVLHSGLALGERHDEWRRLAAGEARIAIGPRSAAFAPVRDLGLVVVDEEHDPSYKHEGDPRYDARSVAGRRAAIAGAVLVAGSATPRPESASSLTRLRLPERVDGRPLPPVEILDMREARSPLHPRARAALAEVRRDGGKAVVLLNRRGWSNFLSCRACGHAWCCPDCDVTLVLHRARGHVACHHCGHREPQPHRCAQCGSDTVARHGAGTERLERELSEALGGADFPIVRLDADSTATRGSLLSALERFDAAPAGVLVGTQMVAKGHDFPDVTLGLVLDADQTLRFPDFRAEERTFSLVAQLAGRAGRGPRGGRVLVQTLSPDAPSILHAAAHDSDGFLEGELARRRALRYPPFATLIRITCSAPEQAAAEEAAQAVRRRIAAPGAEVLGPAPLFRLRGRERRHLVVKAADRDAAIRSVGDAVAAVAGTREGRAATVGVDVDPQ
ncbi:MAG: primosomal protein N' [Solirubrobacteraceae bacterium]